MNYSNSIVKRCLISIAFRGRETQPNMHRKNKINTTTVKEISTNYYYFHSELIVGKKNICHDPFEN